MPTRAAATRLSHEGRIRQILQESQLSLALTCMVLSAYAIPGTDLECMVLPGAGQAGPARAHVSTP
eukprot:1444249-Rhodomonas_salina.5